MEVLNRTAPLIVQGKPDDTPPNITGMLQQQVRALQHCRDAFLQLAESSSGISGLRGGTVADEEKRNVIGLAGATRKIFEGINHFLLQLIEGSVVLAGKKFTEAGDAEHFFFGIRGFGDAVAEKDQRIAGLECLANRSILGIRDQPHWKRTLRENFADDAST